MDEALHLPPMKQMDEEMLSSRGQEQLGVIIAPTKAPEYTAPHVHAKKKSEEREEFEEDEEFEEPGQAAFGHASHGQGVSTPESSDSNDFVKLDKPHDHPEMNIQLDTSK